MYSCARYTYVCTCSLSIVCVYAVVGGHRDRGSHMRPQILRCVQDRRNA